MTDLNELLERVRGAKGPDRVLDDAILKAFGFHSWAGRMSYRDAPLWIDFGSSEITASIDASLALVERLLPDTVRPGFQQNPDRTWSAAILRVEPDDDECTTATGPTAPLAILTALLSALKEVR